MARHRQVSDGHSGLQVIKLKLGPLTLCYEFVIADVTKPILGWDFLEDLHLDRVRQNNTHYLVNKHGWKVALSIKQLNKKWLSIEAVTDSYQKYSQLQTVIDGKEAPKATIPAGSPTK